MSPEFILVPITLVAAVVNGAIGHGFSSITVPLALLVMTSRVLNPALVLVEVMINGYVLVLNRRSIPSVLRRAAPVLGGLVPGVIVGAYLLSVIDPTRLKLIVFAALLPMILLQAAGVRRPIHAERAVSVPFGAGVGVLYSMTTISGPPLALMLNNQGLAKREFRAALAVIRLAESMLTAVAYWVIGLYTARSAELALAILPSVVLGVPLGAALIRRLDAESFRRICMSFDVWIVGFGISQVLAARAVAASLLGYGIWAGAILLDTYLLLSFFRTRGAQPPPVVGAVLGRQVGVAE